MPAGSQHSTSGQTRIGRPMAARHEERHAEDGGNRVLEPAGELQPQLHAPQHGMPKSFAPVCAAVAPPQFRLSHRRPSDPHRDTAATCVLCKCTLA